MDPRTEAPGVGKDAEGQDDHARGQAADLRTIAHGWPQKALAPALAEVIDELAGSIGIARAPVCLLALGALSVITMPVIDVRAWSGFSAPAGIWTIALGDPGARKSPVISALSGPLRGIIDARNDAWAKMHGAAPDSDRPAAYVGLLGDATSEAIESAMVGGPVGVITAEASGILGAVGGRYSPKGVASLGVLCGAYDREPIATYRIGRAPTLIARPALVIVATAQPAVIDGLPAEFRSQGLLARVCLWRADIWDVEGYSRPLALRWSGEWADIIRRVDDACGGWDPARTYPDPRVLDLDPEAHQRFAELEAEARSRGRHRLLDRDLAAKLPGLTLRCAGLLTVSDAALAAKRIPAQIDLATLERAARLAQWLAASTSAALAAGPEAQYADHRAVLVQWMRRLEADPRFDRGFTTRAIKRNGPPVIRALPSEEIDDLLADLERVGAIARQGGAWRLTDRRGT